MVSLRGWRSPLQELADVPDASHLRLVEVEGRRVVMVGARALFAFEPSDLGMRNVAVVAFSNMRFRGTDVATLFGLTPTYVSQLRGRVRDEGSAGLVRDRGRPRRLTPELLEQAARWRAQGWTDVKIDARLGGAAGNEGARNSDLAVLAATSMAFTLGAGTVEGIKNLAIGQAGALCALARMRALSTSRPRLAAMAERVDSISFQRVLATALLAADPDASGTYCVDDHFVPYAGAKPVGKGWDAKHRRVASGRGVTYVVDSRGRALVFTSGELSGLTKTLPPALAEGRAVTGPGAPILAVFDRGGANPSVFTACRDAGADCVAYRRAPLVAPTRLPLVATTPRDAPPRPEMPSRRPPGRGSTRTSPCTSTGTASPRQITWFENGTPAMQVLTSDLTVCPVAPFRRLKSRWRIESAFKNASDLLGTDAMADYLADIETNTRPVPNPARKRAAAALAVAENEVADAERTLAILLADPSADDQGQGRGDPDDPAADYPRHRGPCRIARQTRLHPCDAARERDRPRADARHAANPPPGPADGPAIAGQQRRAHLATALNAYLRDENGYRALTRTTILRGTSGTFTSPENIDVPLDHPISPHLARALDLLVEEMNETLQIPGEPRPITDTLAKGWGNQTPTRTRLSEVWGTAR